MRGPLRALRFVAHVLATAAALAWLASTRRGATLLFTHAPDIDADGRDHQMGPLREGLLARGRKVVEVTLLSLDDSLLAYLTSVRRPFLSHAAVIGLARIWSLLARRERWSARTDIARLCLRALAPRIAYLIDESGSGQTWLRACKSLGIRAVGIQHGDFRPKDPLYDKTAAASGRDAPLPADLFCLWSAWFQDRLLRISAIYNRENTAVVGRLRYVPARSPAPATGALRVLLLSEARADFRDEVDPFARALERESDLALIVRPHPAEQGERWPKEMLSTRSLAEELSSAGVVLGVRSSGLLEALFQNAPAARLDPKGSPASPGEDGASGLEDLFPLCADPRALGELCRRLSSGGGRPAADRARARVWGDALDDPVQAMLELEPPGATQ
jgi:hypothetical protein